VSLIEKYDEGLKEDIAKLEKASAEGENMARDFMRSYGTEESVVEKVARDAQKRGEPIHWEYGSSKHMLDLMEWIDTIGSEYKPFPFRISISRFFPSDCDMVFENSRFSINQEALTIKESEVLKRLMLEVMHINYIGWEAAKIASYYPTSELMSFTANLMIKYNPDDLFKSSVNEKEPGTTEWWQFLKQRIIKECNIPRLEYIIEQMHLPDVDVESAISNGDIGSLIKALDYGLFQVKESVIQALVKINKPAIPSLISALEGKRNNVREAAAETLGRIKDPASTEPLVQLLKDDDLGVRMAAGNALAKIGKSAVPSLIMALTDSRNDVKKIAAETLGKIKDIESIGPLIQLLKDDDSGIRLTAERSLQELGKPAVPFLIEALENDNNNIRNGAATVLGRLKDTEAIDHLCRLLKSKHRSDRISSIEALEKIASSTSTKPIIETLKDKDRDVRRKSVRALGVIGDARALMFLVDIMKKDKDFRQYACEAIGEIFKKSITKDSKEIVDPAVREFITMLGDDYTWSYASSICILMDYPIVDSLIRVLQTSNNRRIRKRIPQILAEKAERESECRSEVLNLLCQSLRDKDKEVKISAAFALEKLQDPRTTDALTKALEDADVRFAAELALKKIKSNE
jgi:HEAT repeat protein